MLGESFFCMHIILLLSPLKEMRLNRILNKSLLTSLFQREEKEFERFWCEKFINWSVLS